MHKIKIIIKILISISILFLFSCSNPTDDTLTEEQIMDKVDDILLRMTLDEKVGQMAQVDRKYLESEEDIKTYFLGSLLSGGGSTPEVNNPLEWTNMIDRYQSIALKTRLGIPLLYGIDAVHGHNNVVGAVIFPHNIGLGCMNNPDLVEQASRITAREVAATGIHWTFSPCIAVPQDDRWGRQYEGFSESPEIVKTLSKSSVLGYQGNILGEDKTSILACAKHFIGDGGTKWGTGEDGMSDRGDTQIDEKTLREIHLPGYISAIEADVGSIMITYSSINGTKMHGHKELITGLLKEELGFEGIIVSDWAGIEEIPGDDKSDIEIAVNAGIDMIMIPEHYVEFLNNIKTLVQEGKISSDRIDEAVRRILRIKVKLGLFEQPYADRSFLTNIGSDEHRNVAKQCVQQSVVLLKNNENILPLSKELNTIAVVGKGADDIGQQCGGWSISWQGDFGNITEGTTILEGMNNTLDETSNIIFSKDGNGIDDADLAILVVGEKPYAEMHGDRAELYLSQEDKVLINKLNNTDIPTITIIFSGRPLIITDYLDNWDALIAAWLPGTEGQGIVDVLFGDYNPTGKLSYSWPKAMSDIPINIGDLDYDPLFPVGFGLTY